MDMKYSVEVSQYCLILQLSYSSSLQPYNATLKT